VSLDDATRTENSRRYCVSTATQEPPEGKKLVTNTFLYLAYDAILLLSSVLQTATYNFSPVRRNIYGSLTQFLSIIKDTHKF
jgi:hypothetical protein